MRVAVITGITLALACVGYHCSSRTTNGNDGRGGTSKISIPTGTQSPTDGLKTRKDLESRYEAMLIAIKGESAKLGMSSLRDSLNVPGTEVRVMVGFGLAFPRCFILRNSNGKYEAFFVTAKIVGGKAAMDRNRRILSTRIASPAPASGWDEFDRFLKDQGIESPIKLSLDDRYTPDPDQETIVVEVKTGSVYSMVFFFSNTESEDGKKAWAVWAKIRREFDLKNIDMTIPRPAAST